MSTLLEFVIDMLDIILELDLFNWIKKWRDKRNKIYIMKLKEKVVRIKATEE